MAAASLSVRNVWIEDRKMTRDECLLAISNAFDGSQVWAVVGFWNIHIETEPKRELVLSNWFVSQNIDKDGVVPEELTEIIKGIRDEDWFVGKNGTLLMCYGFPSGFSAAQRDTVESR